MEHGAERVGTRVRRLRRQREWSIQELAERAGMSSTQLSRIERLLASPTEEKILSLAAALNVPAGVLFAETLASSDAAVVVIPPAFADSVRQLLTEADVPVARQPEATRLILAMVHAICANLQDAGPERPSSPNDAT